eukprot:TRINITY_DN1431_c0_g1_i1.p3 TRINITY_DN1431_c0_g1~~TRINITY_DN1431_c0_g1_i1.p3  ORF type:complete len:152 (+),score=48.70 TRINITY_DN1431_c0_g1_i1:972-1427(+)
MDSKDDFFANMPPAIYGTSPPTNASPLEEGLPSAAQGTAQTRQRSSSLGDGKPFVLEGFEELQPDAPAPASVTQPQPAGFMPMIVCHVLPQAPQQQVPRAPAAPPQVPQAPAAPPRYEEEVIQESITYIDGSTGKVIPPPGSNTHGAIVDI